MWSMSCTLAEAGVETPSTQLLKENKEAKRPQLGAQIPLLYPEDCTASYRPSLRHLPHRQGIWNQSETSRICITETFQVLKHSEIRLCTGVAIAGCNLLENIPTIDHFGSKEGPCECSGKAQGKALAAKQVAIRRSNTFRFSM